MKKLGLFVLLMGMCLVVGCSNSKYQEGVYSGSANDNYGGQETVATADVIVDEKGKIISVYLDTTYTTKDGLSTTKKALKDAYGMKNASAAIGNIEGGAEWYEQVQALEQAVIKHQGIDFISLDEDGKTDAVSGCTIKIDALYKALQNALELAK